MALTLRKLQQMLSQSTKRLNENFVVSRHDAGLLSKAASLVSDNSKFLSGMAHVCNGLVVNSCDCPTCRAVPATTNVRSRVDAWARKYGPNAPLESVLAEEQKLDEQEDSQSSSEGAGDESQQSSPADSSSNEERSEQRQDSDGQSDERAQQTGSAPEQPDDSGRNVREAPRLSPAQEELNKAKEKVAEALKAARKKPDSQKAKAAFVDAKKSLRQARRKASFNRKAMASSPSLSARKCLSTAHGRLQNVPQKLRRQMAELINRLVSQAGTTGQQLGQIPVLSANKLVRRMLVKRPLQNAFKEDSVSGRPVTLFLPDVSPSCASQAQIACDIANAAGFAGVAGSDVLVFPHSNGIVAPNETYFPWFNGKPVTTNVNEIKQLFEDVCGGNSKFKVRVAVFIGDHDAVDRYGSVAALKTVLRVVWLHNYRDPSSRKDVTPVNPGDFLRPDDWSPEADEKLSMMMGCTSTNSMLSGFSKAVK